MPGPGGAKPEGRQKMQPGLLWSAIDDTDLNQDIFGRKFAVFHKNVEIAFTLKYPRIQQFELKLLSTPATVFVNELIVRVGLLGVFVEILHIGVTGDIVQIEIVFLDVFPVVAFRSGQAEGPFLKNGISAVPERNGKLTSNLTSGSKSRVEHQSAIDKQRCPGDIIRLVRRRPHGR
jgi:hypothetical protein